MTRPIVLGAGPAGSVAASLLARAGKLPILLDRDAQVGDAICGGFLSWKTAAALRALGCDPAALGAHRANRLRLFASDKMSEAVLPEQGFGLSRRALDTALRDAAVAAGAELVIERAREVGPGRIVTDACEWRTEALFLATGKHDVRGEARPRSSHDPALGLRIRMPPSPERTKLIGDAIELHLFEGGYAGIVLQEDGSANVCLALRKSAMADAGGKPHDLLRAYAERAPAFAERLGDLEGDEAVDTIGSVPYGWIARATEAGVYRLGDQAAVIPSLAGEGMSIALASAKDAVAAYCSGTSAQDYQAAFARRAARPVRTAEALWRVSETRRGGPAIAALAGRLPALARLAMRLSRI
ncbi:hypothetical protein E3U23_13600 [Erythrobacter litoralis]|uniref:NAD(P)/FAD-dependent oxidoreductase n=1 Tax=Erythrobacter litoralis TaxID=39960 RepID=UPI0024356F3A|nr:FAD-dependent monooxygenase [Erythrobacter litoralis]MDG6080225.1 hypothetical protein [Erythrobacter litoralis]